jgi:uncharacterized membrane protein (DUF485 family)
MPITSAIIVAGIVFAFAAFAVTLVWADIQTQRARRAS